MQVSVSALARNPDTRRAVGLACAAMGANVAALGFTIVFARWLGLSRYGSLAALLSTFNILMIPGVGVQTTAAREVSALVAVGDPAAGAGIRRWISRLVVLTAVLTIVSVLARQPIADVIGVPHAPWAAAIALPAGSLWLIASVMRGSLQGFRRYRLVGISIVAEQVARLGVGLGLVGAGLGVTGAYLATPLALIVIALGLAGPLSAELRRSTRAPGKLERLRDLFRHAGWPVVALALIAWLQEGHVIIVKHLASSNAAGAWGAAAVAAKAIMWIAPGLALYVVPEASRRWRTGSDARRVLALALAIIAVIATAMVLLYAGVAAPLLRAVFKPKAALSAGALPWLGLAMSMLAISYLCAQYQLALHRIRFIAVLAVAAVAQPAILVAIGANLTTLALGMLALQATVAATLVALAVRGRPRLALTPPAAELERVPAALTDA